MTIRDTEIAEISSECREILTDLEEERELWVKERVEMWEKQRKVENQLENVSKEFQSALETNDDVRDSMKNMERRYEKAKTDLEMCKKAFESTKNTLESTISDLKKTISQQERQITEISTAK